MTTKNEGTPEVDPELEALRTEPSYAKFKKVLRAAAADIAAEDAANAPAPKADDNEGPLSFFDNLFGGKK